MYLEEQMAQMNSTLLLILAALQGGASAATTTATTAQTATPAADTAATASTKGAAKKMRFFVTSATGELTKVGPKGVEPIGATEIDEAEFNRRTEEAAAKKASAATPATAEQKPDTSAASSTATAGQSESSGPTFAEVTTAITALGKTPETGRASLLKLFAKWGVKTFPEVKTKGIDNAVLLADIKAEAEPPVAEAEVDPLADLL